ncbi:YqiA/YcfP family alpha/beta fold hydrolase [Treponema sp.]|uniref:YqiA/YcfP family alpha/beta fold hydrolase n=1 Tax=Treponema sp. TaxID=166 RepID=UPI00298DB1D5|nr:YqiA/YcfP family alpha/beta fold hydrolase [Treponema sp.]MCQ2242336.1 hypothetical protein [Treponema sp.]
MANILYIHGFGSNHNSGSFLALKDVFKEHNFFSSDFDLLDVKGTLEKIGKLCEEHEIDLVMGKSLGGFYALAYEGEQDKAVINPCIKPWIEIPKLDDSIPSELLEEWEQLFKKTEENIDSKRRSNTFGIFGDHDQLFSYKDYFDKHYYPHSASLQKSFLVPGNHHIDIDVLKVAVQKCLDFFDMMEEYDYVFSLMPYYQLIKDPDDDYLQNMSQGEKQHIIDSIDRYHDKMIEYQNNKIFETD